MRITFLGTGSAWPIPRIGCGCPQCRSGDPRDVRSRSAALVEAAPFDPAQGRPFDPARGRPGGPALLIDAGPDIYRQLFPLGRERAGAIEAVVITHVHPDHYLGLVDLWAALPRRRAPLPIWHLEDNRRALEATFGYMLGERLAPRPMRFGATFEPAPDIRITPFDAHHFEEFSTSGVLLEGNGRRAAYAPDFRRTDFDLRGLDLLAIDGSALDRDLGGHQSIRSGIELAAGLAPRRTLFTHIGHVKRPHRELEAIVRRDGGPGFGIAHDGLVIEV